MTHKPWNVSLDAGQALQLVQDVGKGIARNCHSDPFWRNSAIEGLTQAGEILTNDELWLALAYLAALQDYSKVGELSLRMPPAQARFIHANMGGSQ